MDRKFDSFKFIGQLVSFSPRQRGNEKKAADLIISFLKNYGIRCQIDNFPTKIPLVKKAELLCDGSIIPCKAASLVSGEIRGKENIVSSLIFSDAFINEPNINFNPESDAISVPAMYFAPALAVSRNSLRAICRAKNVKGTVKIVSNYHISCNILVGNVSDPKFILFAHYDSIGTGAVDNASGVSTLADIIISHPETMHDSLYVFSGQEELSFDEPIYWGRGFRVFEKKYKNIMEKCRKIFIVDSLGNGKTVIEQDEKMAHLAFPISHAEDWKKKIFLCHGDMGKLMKVYHTEDDNINQLKKKYLNEARILLVKILMG